MVTTQVNPLTSELFTVELTHKGTLVNRKIEIESNEPEGYSTSLSNDRDKRLAQPRVCVLCLPHLSEETPEEGRRPTADGAYLVRNLFPFGPDHYVIIPEPEIHPIESSSERGPYIDPMHLTSQFMSRLFSAEAELAHEFQHARYRGVVSFVNFNRQAGGSLMHPHAQCMPLTRSMIVDTDRHLSGYADLAYELRRNPFEAMMEEIRRTDYFISENPWVFIFAHPQPRVPCHIRVISKLDVTDPTHFPSVEDTKTTGASMLGIPHGLTKLGVTDFNLLANYAPFGEYRDVYRANWDWLPRNLNTFGGTELKGFYVVSKDPRYSAQTLREHFSQ